MTPGIWWISADDPPDAFPEPESALPDPNGLLAAGGDLSCPRLLYAYRQGIFPWFEDGQPILWWSPDPRCVIRPAEFHLPRRSARALKTSGFEVSFNRRFDAVIDGCAAPRPGQRGTWITDEMATAYGRLHDEGWCHSIEILRDGRLVGGMYGVAIGRVFFGESMFSAETNASKAALLALCRILESEGFAALDCQVESAHLLTLGAVRLPRTEFRQILREATSSAQRFDVLPGDVRSVTHWLRDRN